MSSIERVALVQWQNSDGIAAAIQRELQALGRHVVLFRYDEAVPRDVDMVFTFAPYNRWLPIAQQVGARPHPNRPLLVHWHTEGMPNPELPLALTCLIAAVRSWVDRCNRNDNALVQRLLHPALLSRMGHRVLRYRYIGDYRYAHKMGWLDVLADHSEVTVAFHRLCGIPAVYVPRGTSPEWWKEMNLERDIDVLWMGQRRNRRRRAVLVHVCRTLRKQGLNVYVADGIENPLIFGEKRTEILNRTRITLNIPTTWYDNCFIARFHMVAGNRCLVVSEPFLMHSAEYQPGVHYVQVETSHLVDTVMYYLEHEEERAAIAENAFQLVTTRLTLRNSVEKLLQVAEEHMRG